MCDKDKEISNQNWKRVLNMVIYNLMYPAYFGNMVYDLFQIARNLLNNHCKDLTDVLWIPFWTGLAIVLFFIVDYIHLYVYMNDVVPEGKRGRAYLLCDLGTTHLFFFGFVFAWNKVYSLGIPCLALIPIITWIYKYYNNKKLKELEAERAKDLNTESTNEQPVKHLLKTNNVLLIGVFALLYAALAVVYYFAFRKLLAEVYFMLYYSFFGLVYYTIYSRIYHKKYFHNEWTAYHPLTRSTE